MHDTMLPIDDHLPAIRAALDACPTLLLRAETGAGKTTRVPPALLREGGGSVMVLEPRRIAARAAARRVATENGWTAGREVGWHIRFDARFGPSTRLLFLTEGMLVRRLQRDPFLEGVDCIVLDEFHERSVHADLALALSRRIQQEVRPDLRIVVMSATIDLPELRAALPDARSMDVPGRTFPVAIRHGTPAPRERIADTVADAVLDALATEPGDVLCFVPGVREIDTVLERLRREAPNVEALPLHGELPAEAQDRVLTPGSGRRVIVATNVAEASLTVPRVRVVIDSGWVRQMRFHHGRGLDTLQTVRVSAASAAQRTGRAGRTEPGVCLRLWPETERLSPSDPPELLRVDPAPVVLQLLAFGERDPNAVPFVTPLPDVAIASAMQQLTRLGALDAHGGLSPMGRALAELPLAPRIGRLLLAMRAEGAGADGALAAALLAERDIVRRDAGTARPDLLTRLEAVKRPADRWPRWVDPARADAVRRVADSLARDDDTEEVASRPNESRSRTLERALAASLALAFPDRVAQRRDATSASAVLPDGRGVRIERPDGLGDAPFAVCLDLDDGVSAAEARVRDAVALGWDDLPSEGLRTEVTLRWDATEGRVVARRQTRWLERVVAESPAQVDDPAAAVAVMRAAIVADPEGTLPLAQPGVVTLRRRVAAVRSFCPDVAIPPEDDAFWGRVADQVATPRMRLQHLAEGELVQALRSALGWSAAQDVDTLAPTRIEVPSGSAIALDWPDEGPPVLAVRIQEVFGWTETPAVCRGRLPVVLHLLAPNYRPQQVTRDLRSFWSSTYHEVRKELRQRYPKHAWPDDPWTAPPVRKGPSRPR